VRIQLSRVAGERIVDMECGTTAGMPGRMVVAGRMQPNGRSSGNDVSRLDGVTPLRRSTLTPPSGGFAQSGEHNGYPSRLAREQRIERGDLVVRRTRVGSGARRICSVC
jgi:hypothetical protein